MEYRKQLYQVRIEYVHVVYIELDYQAHLYLQHIVRKTAVAAHENDCMAYLILITAQNQIAKFISPSNRSWRGGGVMLGLLVYWK